jgi:hypothetical protein
VSVTIRKVPRSSGIRFKAIIRDRSGRGLRSKTVTKLTLARDWAKRIEADRELIAASCGATRRAALPCSCPSSAAGSSIDGSSASAIAC